MASRLLSTQEDNSCVRDLLAERGRVPLNAVSLRGRVYSGAVGDLIHAPRSLALQRIAGPAPIGIYTSMFAAVTSDFSSLDAFGSNAWLIRNLACRGRPLALDLTAARWPGVFTDDSSRRNDGIVSHASQSNGGTTVGTIEGFVIHSAGMRDLGFQGASVLDPGILAGSVIDDLNIPRSNTTRYTVLP